MRNSLRIEPVTPAIGAEISGIDLGAPLDDATVAALEQALAEHLVLFFRDQPLDLDRLGAFGRRFGPPHTHPTTPDLPGHPGIMAIHTEPGSATYAGRMWHSDVSCDVEPPLASILHLHRVPPTGGDTLFASMTAAWDALSPALQGFLEGLTARHEGRHNLGGYFGATQADLRDGKFPEAIHPVVRRHPATGRKALFVNETFTTRIVELSAEESRAVLALLYRHIGRPEFQCRFRWQPDSVAFWDNRAAQHMALRDYAEIRSGHRFTIAGDRPA